MINFSRPLNIGHNEKYFGTNILYYSHKAERIGTVKIISRVYFHLLPSDSCTDFPITGPRFPNDSFWYNPQLRSILFPCTCKLHPPVNCGSPERNRIAFYWVSSSVFILQTSRAQNRTSTFKISLFIPTVQKWNFLNKLGIGRHKVSGTYMVNILLHAV